MSHTPPARFEAGLIVEYLWEEHTHMTSFVNKAHGIARALRDHTMADDVVQELVLSYISREDHPWRPKTPAEGLGNPIAFYNNLIVSIRNRLNDYFKIGPKFDELIQHPIPGIEPVHAEDVTLAAELADQHPEVSTRDLVHAAMMGRLGTDHIISADTGFDRLEGIDRPDPGRIGEWGSSILTIPDA